MCDESKIYTHTTILFFSLFLCRTPPDGNCLYRACSKLLCGKEDMCDLRDLTSIELFNNLQFYACHPYIKEKSHVFQSENTAFSATASDAALADGYDRKDPSSRVEVVKREAIRNATSTTHASFMCVFALSSVTGMVVTSVYPETFQQQTKYSQFQNGTIFPQVAHDNLSSKLVQETKFYVDNTWYSCSSWNYQELPTKPLCSTCRVYGKGSREKIPPKENH